VPTRGVPVLVGGGRAEAGQFVWGGLKSGVLEELEGTVESKRRS
jgi:hypothetical protein